MCEKNMAPNEGNTLNTVYLPIVLVPGLLASRLKLDTNSWFDGDHKTLSKYLKNWSWAGQNRWASSKRKLFKRLNPSNPLENMKEHPKNCTCFAKKETLTTDELDKGWGAVMWECYGRLLRKLKENNAAPVYAFAYDWRQDNRDSAKKLYNFIDKILDKEKEKSDKVALITHSMGGLVARWAMKELKLAEKVHGVIHIAQPVAGSVMAYRQFLTGCLEDDGNWYKWSGRKPENHACIMSAIPSVFQLLPNQYYNDNWLNGVENNLSNKVIWKYYGADSIPGLIQKDKYKQTEKSKTKKHLRESISKEIDEHLKSAEKFQKELMDNDKPYKHDNTYSIYSSGKDTDTELHIQSKAKTDNIQGMHERGFKKINDNVFLKRTIHGDGTVPDVSAAALFIKTEEVDLLSYGKGYVIYDFLLKAYPNERQFKFYGLEHGEICKDSDVIKVVKEIHQEFKNSL